MGIYGDGGEVAHPPWAHDADVPARNVVLGLQ